MQLTPRPRRTARSILTQWAIVIGFFLPMWLVYAQIVAPGLAPEARVTLDAAVPVGAFLFCAGASFAYRAFREHRRARLTPR